MPDPTPDHRPERRDWWLFVGWAVVVYLTIPLARTLERTVGGLWGKQVFLFIGLGAVFLGLATGAALLFRARARPAPSQVLWLAAVGAAYAWYAGHLAAPVEALHFLQYGLLGVLAWRALRHRLADRSVYLCALLLCLLVGTGDEIVQWITPRRYWQFADVLLNGISAGLAQVAIWLGVRPAGIRAGFGAPGLARAARLAAALALLLATCASLTPNRLATASRHLPALAGLRDNPSVMAEYGHRYHDPEIGVFYSRLDPEELARQDRERAAEVAALLDDYRRPDSYGAFLEAWPSWRDPLLHEARVHLFRRDRYFHRARNAGLGEEETRRAITVAWRENLIMERYFPRVLAASTYELPAAERALLESRQLPDLEYRSAVSAHLFTHFSNAGLWAAAAAAAVLLLVVARRLERRGAARSRRPRVPGDLHRPGS